MKLKKTTTKQNRKFSENLGEEHAIQKIVVC